MLREAVNPLIVVGDAAGYAEAWPELQALAELIGAPVSLQTFSSLANFPQRRLPLARRAARRAERLAEGFRRP